MNNAGVYEFAPLEEVTEEHFHKHFDLNVLGLLLATKEAVKHIGPEGGSSSSKWRRIVERSSVCRSLSLGS